MFDWLLMSGSLKPSRTRTLTSMMAPPASSPARAGATTGSRSASPDAS